MEKRKIIPELRFPEFYEEWVKKKVGTITDKVGSGSTPLGGSKAYLSEGVIFIRSQNVNNDTLSLDEVVFISEETNDKMSGSKVIAEDILLNITGASIGRSCVVPKTFQTGNVNQHVCIIRLTQDYSPYFFQPFLSSFKGQKLVFQEQAGGGREGLNFQSIRGFKVYFPTLPEQQKIASFFTAIDKKISQLKQKKTLLEQYKKGVMQEIFSQKIRFRNDNGQKFPKWEKKRLGEVAKFFKGKGVSKNDVADNGNLECIRYGELYTIYRETIDVVKSRTSVNTKDLVLSEADDVIIPASGETQIDIATASCVLKSGIALGGDLNIIRSNFNGVFLSYLLNSKMKREIAKLAQGISVVHLYSSQLSILKLDIPTVLEQAKIASILSAIDTKINHTQTQIDKAELWKKGLLQKMFV